MYDVQVIAADGLTVWIRVRSAKSETTAAAQACRVAKEWHGRKFYPGAVLAAS